MVAFGMLEEMYAIRSPTESSSRSHYLETDYEQFDCKGTCMGEGSQRNDILLKSRIVLISRLCLLSFVR